MDIWEVIKVHFNRGEKWGDPDKVDPMLLGILFILRRETKKPFSIHIAYDPPGTHTNKSYHYTGQAVDFHIVGLTFLESVEAVEKALKELKLWNLVGLGIYPDWNNPGFHLDIRGFKARWSAKYIVVGKDKKVQKYFGYEYGVKYAREKFDGK